ncbi:hypothetical protein Tco_1004592 [Tanacetum coccineum]|uniref:Uncharacterized protein n=1 Tax=Tanacetum coccineum TaxID=301880 RepID=A0ABQ5FDC0_9ASTR
MPVVWFDIPKESMIAMKILRTAFRENFPSAKQAYQGSGGDYITSSKEMEESKEEFRQRYKAEVWNVEELRDA